MTSSHSVLRAARAWFGGNTLRIACASALLGLSTHAQAADLTVLAPNAVKESISEIAARFEKTSGHSVKFTWGGSEAIAKRIANGEVFDVVVTTSPGLGRMAADGRVVDSSRSDFSRSAVGAAVRSGLPRPDLSTVEGLRTGLLSTRAVAISSGASGRYLEQLFQRLGVAEHLKGKIVQPPSGAQIGDLLTRGEADLGFQQVTELMHAKGVDYLGPLPAEVQNYTVWSSAVHARATQAAAAQDFTRALKEADSSSALRKTGLEPM
jgi:molybdate transport system substrate-binding protein